MSKIKYEKMDLFDAPKGSILVHACNFQGVWGSGIAKEFKERFPYAFDTYRDLCKDNFFKYKSMMLNDKGYYIGCLITSENYGNKKDSINEILVNTSLSLHDLTYENLNHKKIYSNKFNSGLFGVPWEKTEEILEVFVKRYSLDWTICVKD